jgi:Arc/MetJ family transcription regulator
LVTNERADMRTRIEIDDDLMRRVLAATGPRTEKAAVEEALKLLADVPDFTLMAPHLGLTVHLPRLN